MALSNLQPPAADQLKPAALPMQSEIEALYDINRALLAVQDMNDIVLVLRATLAMDADEVLHIARSLDDTGILRFLVNETDVLSLDTAVDVKFARLPYDGALFIEDAAQRSDDVALFCAQYDAKSYIQLVLRDQQRARDVLLVIYKAVRTFDEQTRRLFEAFANQSAVIAANITLLQEAQNNAVQLARQVRVLEALNHLANSVGGTSDETSILNAAVRSLVAATDVDHAGVVYIEPDRKDALVVSEYPDTGATGVKVGFESNPIFQDLLKDQVSPLLIEDIENDPRITPLVRRLLRNIGTKSLIIAPLVVNGELIGSLGLDVTTEGRKFPDYALDFVATVAYQIAIYLQDLRARQLREDETRRAQMLDRIGSRFLALNRVDEIVAAAAHGLQGMVNAQRVTIHLGLPDTLQTGEAER
ncbi:MAG: GAF domain-containing protein [Chloroflexota bacterium]|nr:GAF domain-containing protein [Chloroflexota bacterium]